MRHFKKNESRALLFKQIALTFFFITIGIVGVIFYISFSWATILLTPKQDFFTQRFLIPVVENLDSSISQDAIRGAVVQKELEYTAWFSPQETTTSVQRTTGTLTIVNKNPQPQPLRATTRFLSSDGVLLRLKNFTTVPANGQIDAEVYADKEGDLGNFDTSRLTLPALWPAMQEKVYGRGFTPSQSGGSQIGIIRQEDIERAQQSSIEALRDQFSELLSASQGDWKPQNPKNMIDFKVKDALVSGKAGDTVNRFQVTVRATYTGIIYDMQDMAKKVDEKLREQLSGGQDLIPPAEGDTEYAIEDANESTKSALIRVTAKAGKILGEDTEAFSKKNLVGLNKEQIAAYFMSYPDIIDVQVHFYPAWVTRAPFLTDHINVMLKR
ncbi:hypothetical protein HYW94_00995 [Candidatus Uhrbacteria bacterium]|nr:hypothetical protein [Candidatus Uhrbacteria bacterium]